MSGLIDKMTKNIGIPGMGGNETRTEILPKMDVDKEPGFVVPPYDFQAAVPGPSSIGVRRGNSMDSVINATKGVAYYVDVIGFGESSNSLTRSMKFSPIGFNYFIKTNIKCPNGEFMYKYITGIPQGDALSKYVGDELKKSMGVGLKGLAPGMIEDAKAGLNPADLLRGALGDSYGDCVYVRLPVGDSNGNIYNPDGSKFIETPVELIDGKAYQSHWVQKLDARGNPIYIDKDVYDKKAEGLINTKIGKLNPISGESWKKGGSNESFADYIVDRNLEKILPIGIGLAFFGLAYYMRQK